MKTLGLLAVGQSPRLDYGPVIRALAGPSVHVTEKGLLDGLSREEMEALAPRSSSEHPVISRLDDGSSVVMSKPLLTGLVNAKLREFSAEGVDVAVLMCTGAFEGVVCPKSLTLLSGRDIIDGCVRAAVPAGSRLGALVPLASQEAFTGRKFEDMGYEVVTAHASPYGDRAELERAAVTLRGCGAVVLHCMGYTREHREVIAQASGAMVLQSSALVGHVCAELLSER